jgi:hemerythrin-like metal-binding protein
MTTTANQIFPWREAYSVRIPQIDAQHQQLVGLINELHASMLQGNGNEALGRILSELVRYAESHFSYEETLLQQRGYASLPAHRAEHRLLTKQIQDLQAQFRSGKLLMTMQVMQFLKEWLANHILTRDMQYARELAK